jgi:hypothetical protein
VISIAGYRLSGTNTVRCAGVFPTTSAGSRSKGPRPLRTALPPDIMGKFAGGSPCHEIAEKVDEGPTESLVGAGHPDLAVGIPP